MISGTTHCVDSSSCDVQYALAHEPRESNLLLHLLVAVHSQAMEDREDRAEAHSNEHESPNRSPFGRSELWIQHNDECARANGSDLACISGDLRHLGVECTYHRPIHSNQARLSTEPIVNRRHETAPDQEYNTNVIQSVAKLRHCFRVI